MGSHGRRESAGSGLDTSGRILKGFDSSSRGLDSSSRGGSVASRRVMLDDGDGTKSRQMARVRNNEKLQALDS